MEHTTIYHSRKQSLLMFLGCLVLIGVGVFLVIISVSLNPFTVTSGKRFLVGVLGLLFFVPVSIFTAIGMFKTSVYLHFTEEGITINRKLTLWKDIESIKLYQYSINDVKQTSIGIRLRNSDRETSKNILTRVSRSLVDADITIEADTTDFSASRLLTIIEEHRQFHSAALNS
jgi:hypothetical protein